MIREYIIKMDDEKKDIMGGTPLVEKPKNLVRCKDCIHFNADNIPEEGCGYCELLSRTYESEHYCADGERKDADNG